MGRSKMTVVNLFLVSAWIHHTWMPQRFTKGACSNSRKYVCFLGSEAGSMIQKGGERVCLEKSKAVELIMKSRQETKGITIYIYLNLGNNGS
jgi:hypothetical protein